MKITSPKAVNQVLMTMVAFSVGKTSVNGYQSIQGEYSCLATQNQCVSSTTGELLNPRFINIERNVIDKHQCEDLIKSTPEEDFIAVASNGHRYFKQLPSLGNEILSKLRSPDHHGRRCDDDYAKIPLSRVTETTRPHQDRHVDESKLNLQVFDDGDGGYGSIVDEEVVLLYLNNNPDAFFVYGEEKIAVECGTKVTFHGGYPHHTEINNPGSAVKFLGPVTTKDCSKVGEDGSSGKGGSKGGKGGRYLRADDGGGFEYDMDEDDGKLGSKSKGKGGSKSGDSGDGGRRRLDDDDVDEEDGTRGSKSQGKGGSKGGDGERRRLDEDDGTRSSKSQGKGGSKGGDGGERRRLDEDDDDVDDDDEDDVDEDDGTRSSKSQGKGGSKGGDGGERRRLDEDEDDVDEDDGTSTRSSKSQGKGGSKSSGDGGERRRLDEDDGKLGSKSKGKGGSKGSGDGEGSGDGDRRRLD